MLFCIVYGLRNKTGVFFRHNFSTFKFCSKHSKNKRIFACIYLFKDLFKSRMLKIIIIIYYLYILILYIILLLL